MERQSIEKVTISELAQYLYNSVYYDPENSEVEPEQQEELEKALQKTDTILLDALEILYIKSLSE